jgi:hypothetical protein
MERRGGVAVSSTPPTHTHTHTHTKSRNIFFFLSMNIFLAVNRKRKNKTKQNKKKTIVTMKRSVSLQSFLWCDISTLKLLLITNY